MSALWFGRFFSLWDQPSELGQPSYRVGGPEAGGLFGGSVTGWSPTSYELYVAIFEGLLSGERSDLFVSTLHDTDRRHLAGLLEPMEMLTLPIEWDDHDFEVLSLEEFETGAPAEYSTVCFASPGKGVREALSWIWPARSQSSFPLLGIRRRSRELLTPWLSGHQPEGDARTLLLRHYDGLAYLGCPRELYVVGGESVVRTTTTMLQAVEQELLGHSWLQKAREALVCSADGTYYADDDPRAQAVPLAGRLEDLAAPLSS